MLPVDGLPKVPNIREYKSYAIEREAKSWEQALLRPELLFIVSYSSSDCNLSLELLLLYFYNFFNYFAK